MATAPKFAQELTKRISSTRGVLASERPAIRQAMNVLAFEGIPSDPEQAKLIRTILLTLQVAARDEQVWTALGAFRASLGK